MSDKKRRRARDRTSGPATLISDGCKITGSLTGNGDFIINGEVDGDCDVNGSITLAANGTWRGSISATSVIVAGTVEGDVTAEGHVEIANTARIDGTVSGESIAVAVGAVVEGVMQTRGQKEPLEYVEKREQGA